MWLRRAGGRARSRPVALGRDGHRRHRHAVPVLRARVLGTPASGGLCHMGRRLAAAWPFTGGGRAARRRRHAAARSDLALAGVRGFQRVAHALPPRRASLDALCRGSALAVAPYERTSCCMQAHCCHRTSAPTPVPLPKRMAADTTSPLERMVADSARLKLLGGGAGGRRRCDSDGRIDASPPGSGAMGHCGLDHRPDSSHRTQHRRQPVGHALHAHGIRAARCRGRRPRAAASGNAASPRH